MEGREERGEREGGRGMEGEGGEGEGRMEGGREGWREEGKEGGREGGDKREYYFLHLNLFTIIPSVSQVTCLTVFCTNLSMVKTT